jgi:hypothetical protein
MAVPEDIIRCLRVCNGLNNKAFEDDLVRICDVADRQHLPMSQGREATQAIPERVSE